MAGARASSVFFVLKLPGRQPAYFSEVTGLGTETPERWTTIVLSRGIDSGGALWEWRRAVLDGEVASHAQDCTIDTVDENGAILCSHSVARAWPVKYASPGLNAGGAEILIETLELAHAGTTRTA